MKGAGGRWCGGVCALLGAGLLAVGGWQAAGQPGKAVLATMSGQLSDPLRELTRAAQPAPATPLPTAAPAATPAAVPAGLDTAALDAFCAAQAGSFSVYIRDLASGEEYRYAADVEYYPASVLKAAYALWLCESAEAGYLDLSGEVYNFYGGELATGALADYATEETIPIWAVLHAMIARSDNQAARLLAAVWPGDAGMGFPVFLQALGFHLPESCQITVEDGIWGIMDVEDAGLLMCALYDYFETDTEIARRLQSCFLDADHTALYTPEGVATAKKYGSWDAAFHDLAIVYAAHPYILCCMTDQGNAEVDFPAATVEAMQQLGALVYNQLNTA